MTTFIEMTEEKDIGQVEINQEDNEIVFTDKDGDDYLQNRDGGGSGSDAATV